ncbi:MAG TPA: helix-turn-helix transcriptional regulator [Ktedonobacterales bacterium]|nr:helix-turn-helix transcriptional regulator [Ktedonobacterales bacterium]
MGAISSNTGTPGAANSEENWRAVFSERLRKLREEAGQTQRQVAEALGFTSESVYQLWEKPDGNLPSAPNLRKLALHFNVPVDYLLGMQRAPQPKSVPLPQEKDSLKQAKRQLFQLALHNHDYTSPEVASLYPLLRRSLYEPVDVCYRRVLTDAIYPSPPEDLPSLEAFRTPAAQRVKQAIEQTFHDRPAKRARRVTLYVLDLDRVPPPRLQRILLGMQGAELMKQRRNNFTLAVSNGWMARNVLMAPNLARGDIENVRVIPFTLGRTQSDRAAATVLVSNFAYIHADYGVEYLNVQDTQGPRRVDLSAHALDLLAFMGVGAVGEPGSFFAGLLKEKGWNPEELRKEHVIGNVLYHLIREDPGPSWSIYEPPAERKIAVDLYAPDGDEVLHTLSLDVLQRLVEIGEAQIVVLANGPNRAPIIRAALEMQWANTVICTLDVAKELFRLLSS